MLVSEGYIPGDVWFQFWIIRRITEPNVGLLKIETSSFTSAIPIIRATATCGCSMSSAVTATIPTTRGPLGYPPDGEFFWAMGARRWCEQHRQLTG